MTQPAISRRRLQLCYDKRCLVIVLILLGIGLSMVASSSSFFAGGKFDDQFALTRRHLVRVAIALIVLVLAMKIDYRVYRRISPALLLVGIALVAGLYVFGQHVRNTPRWYALPLLGGTIQPSDVSRVTLMFFLAYWITRKGKDFSRFRTGFLPAAMAVLGVTVLIARLPSYGTAAATALISMIILFAGGARIAHLLALAGVFAGGAGLRLLHGGYVMKRTAAWALGHGNAGEISWQVHQSLIGLGSGGIFGVGIGGSEQKLNWLPDSYTDFIFSILGEEIGLIGTLLVSGMFLLLALRALKLSSNCDDRFGEMLAVGVSATIFVYAILNMYVATGLFPVTGLPLPFLSYGGSALVMNAFAVGVLLSVSRRGHRWSSPATGARA